MNVHALAGKHVCAPAQKNERGRVYVNKTVCTHIVVPTDTVPEHVVFIWLTMFLDIQDCWKIFFWIDSVKSGSYYFKFNPRDKNEFVPPRWHRTLEDGVETWTL